MPFFDPIRYTSILFIVFIVWFQTLSVSAKPVVENSDTITIRFALQPSAIYCGYYAAVKKGFFDSTGYSVKLEHGSFKENVYDLVNATDAEYGVGTSEVLLERSNGKPFVLLNPFFQNASYCIYTKPEYDLDSLSYFNGKKIYAIEWLGLREVKSYMLERGISLDSVDFITDPELYSLQRIHDDDFGGIVANFAVTTAEFFRSGDSYKIIRPYGIGHNYYGGVFFTTEKEIDEYPERVRAIQDAVIKGWEYVYLNPGEVATLVKQYDPTLPQTLIAQQFRYVDFLMKPNIIEIGLNSEKRWDEFINSYVATGYLDNTFTLEGFFYEEYFDSYDKLINIILLVLGGATIILMIAFLWVYQLRKQVKRHTEQLQDEHKQRKIAEESLSLRAQLLDATKDAIILMNSDAKLVYVNKSTIDQLGFSKTELLQKRITDILTDEMKKNHTELLENVFEKGEAVYETEFITSQNEVIPIEAYAKVIELEGEKLILSVDRDISDRKRTEKIQNALYKISEAVNSTDNMDNLYKEIHSIVSELMPVNNFYIALYDDEEDMISFPYHVDEYDPPPTPKKPGRGLTELVLRTGKDWLIDDELDMQLRKDGEVDLLGEPTKIWLGVALKIVDHTMGVLVVQDYENEETYGEEEKQILIFVSEQIALAIEKKRAEEQIRRNHEELERNKELLENRAQELTQLNDQLREREKLLQELVASKDKFFSIIAHDLKTPFTALIGLSEYMAHEIDDLSEEEIITFSTKIHKSAKGVFNLLQNLLQWSRVQTDRIDFVPENILLESTVKDIFDLYKQNANKKQIDLISEIEDGLEIYADINMLDTILRNLVSNAIKFTKEGGEVKIGGKIKNNMAEIFVRDNGVGMKPETMKKLFRIDINITTLGTDKEKGTGLGLILCKEFVEKNGGEIRVESEQNVGTTFIFTLPITS